MVLLRLLITAATLAARMPHALAFSETGTEAGRCKFANEPIDVGSFWDPTCEMGKLGCNADGRNTECRLCGAGAYKNISCPASSCRFQNEPFVSYYWDNECHVGKLGCWADGVHAQCSFCGDHPYTSIPCPEHAAVPNGAGCAFKNEPEMPYYWEAGCTMGKHGCNADGVNVHCRFCGRGDYWDIPCPAEQLCQFDNKPTVPYFWDSHCKDGMLGCKADGVHSECRFCATRPFEDIPCPEDVAPPTNVCTWPLRGEPKIPYFWDRTCKMGMLGCWADGLHAECRFCGSSVYSEVTCPNMTSTVAPDTTQSVSLRQQLEGVPTARAHGSLKAGDEEQAPAERLAVSKKAGPAHDKLAKRNDEETLSGAPVSSMALPLLVLAGLVHMS